MTGCWLFARESTGRFAALHPTEQALGDIPYTPDVMVLPQ